MLYNYVELRPKTIPMLTIFTEWHK